MADLVLGPFAVGIDHASSDTALPKGAVSDAVNGDFNREGEFVRRHGYTQRAAQSGLHSIWASSLERYFCGRRGELCEVSKLLDITPIAQTNSETPFSFDELNEAVIFTNRGMIGRIDPTGPRALVPSRPVSPSAVVHTSGALSAGRYAVAVSTQDDRGESALSPAAFVTLTEGQGIRLEFPSSTSERLIYRTTANGDQFYLVATVPGALTQYVIGETPLGRLSETRHLEELPAGSIIREWQGRVLVARGNTVYISEAMRYGLYSPRHGFIQFASRVRMIEPVTDGFYVGTAAGVWFLSGTRPEELTQRDLSAASPYEGSSVRVPSSVLGGDAANTGSRVALWLSRNGFAIGLPGGQVIEPQASRIAIESSGATQARTFVHDRRVTSIVQ